MNKWLMRARFSTKLLTLICFKLTYIYIYIYWSVLLVSGWKNPAPKPKPKYFGFKKFKPKPNRTETKLKNWTRFCRFFRFIGFLHTPCKISLSLSLSQASVSLKLLTTTWCGHQSHLSMSPSTPLIHPMTLWRCMRLKRRKFQTLAWYIFTYQANL